MKLNINSKTVSDFFLPGLFGVLVFSLFLNVKVPITEAYSYFLGEKKDFLIIFLYLSDIFLISFILLSLYALYKQVIEKSPLYKQFSYLLVALLILPTFSFWTSITKLILVPISIYYLLLFTKALVLHETVKGLGKMLWGLFSRLLLVSVIGEAVLAIYQFSYQHNLGIQWVGESILGPYMYGPAKVETLGQVFVRAYGTFQHPNVFAAFLVLGLALGLKFALDKAINIESDKYLLGILGVNLITIGLLFSFSRAAWLAGLFVLVSLFVFTWNTAKGGIRKRFYLIYGSVALTLVFSLLILAPLVKGRANIFDKAYLERRSYNAVALDYIKENPLFGVGPGESLIHMEHKLGEGAQPWQLQPIHNYYLLLGSEIGLPALLLFIWYLLHVGLGGLKLLWRHKSELDNSNLAVLLVGLASCLLLMLFDHYFYTIQATVLLFWIWFGFTASEVAHETRKVSQANLHH